MMTAIAYFHEVFSFSLLRVNSTCTGGHGIGKAFDKQPRRLCRSCLTHPKHSILQRPLLLQQVLVVIASNDCLLSILCRSTADQSSSRSSFMQVTLAQLPQAHRHHSPLPLSLYHCRQLSWHYLP